MSTTINGVTLDNDMYWDDEFQTLYGAGAADRAIDGALVVQQAPLIGGRPLTLVGYEDRGWQKRSTVISLMNLTAIGSRTPDPFVVTINGTNYSCLFRFEDNDSPVSFSPVVRATEPGADNWYYGTIKLRIVA